MSKTLEINCRVYGVLLCCYPGEFRRRFGEEMRSVFEQLLVDEWNTSRLRGLIRVWSGIAWDLLTVAIPLHLRSRTVLAGALSLLTTSVLFLLLSSTFASHCRK